MTHYCNKKINYDIFMQTIVSYDQVYQKFSQLMGDGNNFVSFGWSTTRLIK